MRSFLQTDGPGLRWLRNLALLAVAGLIPVQASAVSGTLELDTTSCTLTSSCAILGGDFAIFAPQTVNLTLEETSPTTQSIEILDLMIPDINVVPSFVGFDVVSNLIGEVTTSGPDAGKVEFGFFEVDMDPGPSFFMTLSTETVFRPQCGSFSGDVRSGSRLDFVTGEITLIGSMCTPSDLLFTMIVTGTLETEPVQTPEPTTLALLGSGLLGLLVRRKVSRR